MFTGIVEGTGQLVERVLAGEHERIWVELGPFAEDSGPGSSIAINGTCLTVAQKTGSRAAFDLAGETLRCTNLGRLVRGAAVNLERAMRLSDRLDGHLVQGHVDGVGVILRFEGIGDDRWLVVSAGRALLEQMIPKGSIAVDGISLTVAELAAGDFSCTILPHTYERTNLPDRRVGDLVNLELDCMGKWARRILEPWLVDHPPPGRGPAT